MIKSTHRRIRSYVRRIDWPLVVFFVLAYTITWGLIPVLDVIARRSGLPDWRRLHAMGEVFDFDGTRLAVPEWVVYGITRVQDFAFSLAGVAVIVAVRGRAGLAELGRRLVRWRVRWYWYLVAFLPLGWYALGVAAAGGLPSFQVSTDLVAASLIGLDHGFIVFLLLRGAMGEEPGLRGFALPRLLEHTTPLRASLVIGVLWGPWHLPALLGRSAVEIGLFLISVLALACVFTWLFNSTAGSLIPVLIFHAAQNSAGMVESHFPALAGSGWELVPAVAVLVAGIAAAVWLGRRAGVSSAR
ncbi:CPBP family intramembrane glutamic endopeptidase [Nonomuraea sp. M3C6]|uniref:CPBP family intramembrane glutamic endopeptidase n=1 Tax=Nonomuraea marmarensis TaxID=3351344 RepID=A0ABW7AGT6_9ACTN